MAYRVLCYRSRGGGREVSDAFSTHVLAIAHQLLIAQAGGASSPTGQPDPSSD